MTGALHIWTKISRVSHSGARGRPRLLSPWVGLRNPVGRRPRIASRWDLRPNRAPAKVSYLERRIRRGKKAWCRIVRGQLILGQRRDHRPRF